MKQDEIIRQAVASVGNPSKITRLQGGDINDVYRVDTNERAYCIKLNSASRFPGMFEAEVDGLTALHGCQELIVPEVISTGEVDNTSFLLLEFIHSGAQTKIAERNMGTGLASLHKISNKEFGWEGNNYIGSLPQDNTRYKGWVDFFVESRLRPQIEMAEGYLTGEDYNAFERLFVRLNNIFPQEPPSLLHGDLWGGNWMATVNGEACIYDPAVYFGHREMDIAMTRLFGGFGSAFYDAYQESLPLARGWQERVSLCNLYPLLVHVNLFGSGYLSQVRQVLSKFT